MNTAKQEIEELLTQQPEDISHEELIRTLAFELMVTKGLKDSEAGRVISDSEMKHRIQQWHQQ